MRFDVSKGSMLAMCVKFTLASICFLTVAAAAVSLEKPETGNANMRPIHRVTKRGVVAADYPHFNRKLRIATIQELPYVNISKSSDGSSALRITGFVPDIVEALSRRLRFEYEYYVVDSYGRLNATTGEWSGLIGEVIRRDIENSAGNDYGSGADMAAAALTITAARVKVVDFLKPFQHLGLTVVVRRPEPRVNVPYAFGIFEPFEPTVWALIILTFVVVGLFLWVMNMFNPYEWAGLYGVGQAEKQQAEQFSLLGSMWFAFTTLQWQGFERSPKSVASRFLSCVWFAFVTVAMVTYTAGVVNHLHFASSAHLSGGAPSRPRFVDLGHIVASPDMKYGTIRGGMSYKYVTEVASGEEFDVIRRYWKTEEGSAQLVSSSAEGLERVRREQGGNYAFIMESLRAQHEINRRPCDLVTVGETFGRHSYGFALPANATPQWFLDELHLAVLEMEEAGDMEELERRWFRSDSQCWNVTLAERLYSDVNGALSVDRRPKRVDVATFTGPLVLVLVGVGFSLAIAVVEATYYRYRGRYQGSNRSQTTHLSMEPEEGNI